MSSSDNETLALSPINEFLVSNDLRISDNPCVSPDFCLDWNQFVRSVEQGDVIKEFPESAFVTEHGNWVLVENEQGDHAWCLSSDQGSVQTEVLENGVDAREAFFPASFQNLIRLKISCRREMKNTAFPTAGGDLGKSTLGIGARFTTLHWDGVDWAMSRLGKGLTANQNSIPRNWSTTPTRVCR